MARRRVNSLGKSRRLRREIDAAKRGKRSDARKSMAGEIISGARHITRTRGVKSAAGICGGK